MRDPELAALLTGWTGMLLITCRHPFSLGETPQARLTFRRLGPLTRSGAAELTTSLPAIRLLGDAERNQAWRLTAGHPLAMEYLDLLLARGERYQDLASRIEAAITAGNEIRRTEPTELPEATAEQIASAAGDLMSGDLFGRLGTAARSLLIRASVFRVPVTAEALAPGPVPSPNARRPGCSPSVPATSSASIGGRPERCTSGWQRQARAPSWPRRTGRRPRTGCPAVSLPRKPYTTSVRRPN